MVAKVLNDFLYKYGFDCYAEFVPDSDCYYDDSEYTIIMGNKSNLKADKCFIQYCKELGLKGDYSIDTLSFFHELGHFETLHLLNEDEEKISCFVKTYCNANDETDEMFMAYFTCPEEKIATEWAVDFLNEFSEECHKFDDDFQEVLNGKR